MLTRSRLFASALLASALVLGAGAPAKAQTAYDQALLASLGPAMQTEVKTRMSGGGQKVNEIIETILLNKISLAFASGKIVATDMAKGVVVAEGRDGQLRAFFFDVATLDLKQG